MDDFWEKSFIEKQTMWGFEPCESAIIAKDLFLEQKVKNVLIPGIGYGRNAKLFLEKGMTVTGIEISKTAIDLAKKHYGPEMKIYHGSVTDMPFDTHLYEGIFCYGLIYLLNAEERQKLIRDCFNQLQPNGIMVFSVISKNSPNYGIGKQIDKDWYEIPQGARLYFYDESSINREFKNHGLTDFIEIDEPVKNISSRPPFKFWLVKCKK